MNLGEEGARAPCPNVDPPLPACENKSYRIPEHWCIDDRSLSISSTV